MRWVRWSRWTDQGMVEFGQGPLNKLEESIPEFEREARKVMEETKADHVVYAVKYYDDSGELEEIRFYMTPMTDKEFQKDVASMPGVRVYALHSRKEGEEL